MTLLRPFFPRLVLLAGISLVVNGITLAYPLVLQRIIDSYATGTLTPAHERLFLLILTMMLVGLLANLSRKYLVSVFSAKLDLWLSTQVVQKILTIPYRQLLARSSGEWLVTMEQVQTLKWFFGQTGNQLLFDAVLVLGYAGLFSYFDPLAGVAYLLVAALSLLAMHWVGTRLYGSVNRAFDAKAEAETYLVEGLHNAVLVRSFSLGHWIQQRWQRPYETAVTLFKKGEWTSGAVSLGFDSFRTAAPVLLLLWKLPEVEAGHLTLGTAVALSSIVGACLDPFLSLSELSLRLQEVRRGLVQLETVTALPQEPDQAVPPHQDIAAPLSVQLSQVSFRYAPSAERPTLDTIDLTIPPGARIGIVGPNGSGKTTLLRLIQRLYEPDSGTILIDGQPATSMPLGALRRSIGVVGQQDQLFRGTLTENIALGDPTPDFAQVKHCAQLAHATEFIERLPGTWDYRIGQEGSALSAGQAQRVALARALYWRPRLLLLDEPTSALDPVSELELEQAFDDVSANRTVVIVAHRLRAIARCNKIYVLHEGRIAESGSHQDLLAHGGFYRKFWTAFAKDAAPVARKRSPWSH